MVIWYMALADILWLDFDRNGTIDHTMIVTKWTSNEIYMTYHTTDTLNKSSSSLWATYGSTAWFYSYRT